MLIGAALAIATIVLQVRSGLITESDWTGHQKQWILSVALPFAVVIGIHLIWRILSTPPKLHAELQSKNNELATFKESVEDQFVSLKPCDVDIIYEQKRHFVFPTQPPTWKTGSCVLARFMNPSPVPGVPGKIAKSVAAKITYFDANGVSFQLDGRWADTTQPAALHPLASKNELLRVDFDTGATHELDVAVRFHGDSECYAVNNDGVSGMDRKLVGPTIRVEIKLVAQYVNQTFTTEFTNPADSVSLIVKKRAV
jgi:hypothetical protein